MLGTHSVSFSAAARPAAIEILPPTRQSTLRPVPPVGRARPPADAAEQFTPQKPDHRQNQRPLAEQFAPRQFVPQEFTSQQFTAKRAQQDDAQTRRDQARQEPEALAAEARAASAQVLGFPGKGAGMAATGFVAQVLAQNLALGREGDLPSQSAGYAKGVASGNEAYRRAGGEPTIYREEPAYFRVAI